MFLQNFVFSCTKRMKKFRERSSAGPHTEAESDEDGGRVNCPASEADQQLVRESLGKKSVEANIISFHCQSWVCPSFRLDSRVCFYQNEKRVRRVNLASR